MAVFNMKQSEVKGLVAKIRKFVTGSNKVVLSFGLPGTVTAKTCDCHAQISNVIATGGFIFHAEGEFDVNSTPDTPIYKCNVDAGDFCNYMSGLSNFDSDISIGVSEKNLVLSAGDSASTSLPLIPDEQVETPLPNNVKEAIAKVAVHPESFLKVANLGCSLADGSHETYGNVFLYFEPKKETVTGYSIDNSTRGAMSTAWGKCGSSLVQEQLAFQHLKNLSKIMQDSELKKKFQLEVKEKMKNKEHLVAFAVENGYVEQDTLLVSFTPKAFELITFLMESTTAGVVGVVTPTITHLQTKEFTLSVSMVEPAPSVLRMVSNMVGYSWDSNYVLDHERFTKSLSLIKLATEKPMFKLEVLDSGLEASVMDARALIPFVVKDKSNSQVIEPMHFKFDLLGRCISHFPKGNVRVSYSSSADAVNKLIRLSNGATESDVTAHTFIMGCNVEDNE